MRLRAWWWTTLLLAGLGLVMGGAHVLELPTRAQYDAELYMRVTSTMYRYFGLVGGPLQVIGVVFAAVLAWRIRSRPGFRYTAAGAASLVVSLVLWFALVQPVNAAWAEALGAGTEEAVRMYGQLRGSWETGHVAAFCAWLVGFGLLLAGVTSNLQITRGPDGTDPS